MPPKQSDSKLGELDWDFDNVPNEELVACCYWEYARESKRIRSVYNQNDVTFFPPSMSEAPAGSAKSGRILDQTRGKFISEIWDDALPVKLTHDRACQTVPRPFEHPWLGLPPAVRSAVIEELAPYHVEKPALAFLPFNRCPDMHDLGLAYEGYRCAEFDAELGIEYLRVQIDWAGFTDTEIVEAFKAWLGENRPPGVGVADTRGRRKQKGFRDYLAWLGMMRLMSICPFTSIEREMPKVWSHYRSADWPRARKKALALFKSLFPFLPQEDTPIHWQTAGRRAK